VKFLRAVELEKKGLIKRVRGVCSGSKVAPALLNQVISASRAILNDFLPDVWVYSDLAKKG
jgi:RNA 3'-terminal phosphate cyclase-like protein